MQKAIGSAEYRRLCAHLRELREQTGLRQKDLADRLDVPQSVVSAYENGQRRLDIIELDQICAVLGADLADVVRRAKRT